MYALRVPTGGLENWQQSISPECSSNCMLKVAGGSYKICYLLPYRYVICYILSFVVNLLFETWRMRTVEKQSNWFVELHYMYVVT